MPTPTFAEDMADAHVCRRRHFIQTQYLLPEGRSVHSSTL